jgi:small multidrug resistance pump
MNSWWYLIVAIPFGVLGTISMKLSHGLKKWKPSLCLAIFYITSFAALTLAIQGMDLSMVYAIWSGIGTILIAIIGTFVFDESMTLTKVISIMCIVVGVMGVHLTNAAQ